MPGDKSCYITSHRQPSRPSGASPQHQRSEENGPQHYRRTVRRPHRAQIHLALLDVIHCELREIKNDPIFWVIFTLKGADRQTIDIEAFRCTLGGLHFSIFLRIKCKLYLALCRS